LHALTILNSFHEVFFSPPNCIAHRILFFVLQHLLTIVMAPFHKGNCPDDMLLYLRLDEASFPMRIYYGLHNTTVGGMSGCHTGKVKPGADI